MDSKYVSKKTNGIISCPLCRGVIVRDFRIDKATGKIAFMMRCPHCQKNVSVSINDGIMVKTRNHGIKDKT